MQNFWLIVTHYLKRNFLDKMSYLQLILPLGFIFLNGIISDEIIVDGYNIVMTMMSPLFMISFQFFACTIVTDWLFRDFEGPVHWRLWAAPLDQRVFFGAILLASWLTTFIQGLLIIVITTFFNANLGNLGVTLLVLFIISIMSQVIGLLIFYFAKSYKGASTFMYVFGFSMMLTGNALFPIDDLPQFILNIFRYSPLNLGVNAIMGSGPLSESMSHLGLVGDFGSVASNVGILVAMTAVLSVLSIIFGKRREKI